MARTERLENVTIENAKIRFRNFSGKEGQYNRAGDRNFNVFLEHDLATAMEADGWPVRYLKPKEDGDIPQPIIEVKVKYGGKARPPRVVLVTSRGRSNLDEDDVDLLDWADIANVDLIIRPYHWDVNGRTGISAYCQSIYVTINEDELELKYADVPDSAQNTVGRTPGAEEAPPWDN